MKKIDPAELAATYGRISERCESNLSSLEEIIAEQCQGGIKRGLIVQNLSEMAFNALCQAMQQCRHKQDFSAGQATMQRFMHMLQSTLFVSVEEIAEAHRDFFQKLYPKKSPPGFYLPELFYMLHACLFAGDWTAAQKLAQLVREKPLAVDSGASDPSATLIACAMVDDLTAFEACLDGKDPFEERGTAYANYPMMYWAALKRDHEQFAHWYGVIFEEFKNRARARGNQVHAVEYGFSAEYNLLTLDFQGISACKVAQKLGVPLPPPTEYIPAEVVSYWQ